MNESSIEGYFLKPHIHKTHDETVYVIEGTPIGTGRIWEKRGALPVIDKNALSPYNADFNQISSV